MGIYQHHNPEEAFLAFNELYLRFNQNIYSYLNKKCQHSADAEDLLQKIFIKMHESKHLYKNKYSFEQWIFVIARTSVIDFYRMQARYQTRIKKCEVEVIEMIEDARTLNLNSEQKELLELKFIDDLSYKEISRLLNKSEMSLRKTVSRIVSHLKKGEL